MKKRKSAAELVVANTELAFKMKRKSAAELVVANTKLVLQDIEKKNRQQN
jgi:hypothetical protein